MLGLSVLLCGCGGKSVEKEGTGTYTNDSGEKTTARAGFFGKMEKFS